MRIRQVRPLDNWALAVEAEDGRSGQFDVRPYLADEAFTPLRDIGEFRKVVNGFYFVEWDCGADLSADTIEARWQVQPSATPAPKSAPRRHKKARTPVQTHPAGEVPVG